MKRKLFTLLLALGCVFGVTGMTACGDSLGNSASSSKKENSSILKGDRSKDSVDSSSSGKEEPSTPTEGLKYTLSEDETYYIVSIIGTATDIVIPATYNNLPVKEIGEKAFYNCYSLTRVTIPDSVTTIGYQAFYGCYKLVEVINKSSLTITAGSSNNGGVARYAKQVIANETDSKIIKQNDYIFYNDNGNYCLLGYVGSATELVLPNDINENEYAINQYTFYGCDNITSITLPFVGASKDGTANTHFGYIFGADSYYSNDDYVPSSLKTVVITGGSSIAESAFYDCDSITSITLPFVGASKDGTENTHFGYIFGADSYYSNDDYVPSSLKTVVITGGSSIAESAFYDCDSITSVTIPKSVTSVGEDAFAYCYNLTSVYIKDIKAWCAVDFANRYGNPLHYAHNLYLNDKLVTDLVIPNSVTSIGAFAFAYCDSITSVTIPESVTSVEEDSFAFCNNVTSVYIKDIKAWCAIDFQDNDSNPLYYAKNLYLNNELVTNLVIPDSVITIGKWAFMGCNSLTGVTIPDSVTSVGKYAFYACSSLTSITVEENNANYTSIDGNLYSKDGSILIQYAIGKTATSITLPDSVTTIGKWAFLGCGSLTSVIIPDSVTYIGEFAFYDCYSLTRVTFKNPNGWKANSMQISATDLADTSMAATYLTDTYDQYTWTRQ